MFSLECPSALTMIDITLVLVFHILLILIYTSLYLLSFSISFSWMLALSGTALPISRHVLSQLYITMSNYCCQCEDFVWNAPMVLVGHLYSQVLVHGPVYGAVLNWCKAASACSSGGRKC